MVFALSLPHQRQSTFHELSDSLQGDSEIKIVGNSQLGKVDRNEVTLGIDDRATARTLHGGNVIQHPLSVGKLGHLSTRHLRLDTGTRFGKIRSGIVADHVERLSHLQREILIFDGEHFGIAGCSLVFQLDERQIHVFEIGDFDDHTGIFAQEIFDSRHVRIVVGDAQFANRTDSQRPGIVEFVELLNGLIALVILAFQLALFLLDFANTGVVRIISFLYIVVLLIVGILLFVFFQLVEPVTELLLLILVVLLYGVNEVSVTGLDVVFINRGLGHVAVGHNRTVIVDEETGAGHPRAVVSDLIDVERDVLQISVFVQIRKEHGLAVGEFDFVVVLVENEHYPTFVLVEEFGLRQFAFARREQQQE